MLTKLRCLLRPDKISLKLRPKSRTPVTESFTSSNPAGKSWSVVKNQFNKNTLALTSTKSFGSSIWRRKRLSSNSRSRRWGSNLPSKKKKKLLSAANKRSRSSPSMRKKQKTRRESLFGIDSSSLWKFFYHICAVHYFTHIPCCSLPNMIFTYIAKSCFRISCNCKIYRGNLQNGRRPGLRNRH